MILDDILASKRKELAERKAAVPEAELARRASAGPAALDFAAAIARKPTDPIRLIAEFKRASPSKGVIRADLAPADVARRYADAGAAAISVLTDGPFFSGSLEDLAAVRHAVRLPILRKDFILDRYQLVEARAAGADAALLIVAALDDATIRLLQREAAQLGMAALVEVHDEVELDRALAHNARIIGVNNRDLRSFRVNPGATLRLRPRIPAGVVVVSESGIRSREDALRLEQAGVDAILVGEFLMTAADPGAAAAALLRG